MKKFVVVLLAFAITAGAFASGTQQSPAGTSGEPPAKLAVMVFDRGNVPAEYGAANDNVWTRWIQEQVREARNLDVSFVGIPRAQERDRLNTLMASGDAPDIIFTYAMDLFYSYASQGGLTDLTDLLDQYGPNVRSLVGEDGLQFGRVAGEQLMVPAKRAHEGIFADWIRKDWLDAVGLPMPTTTDEWYTAIRTIKEKDPGNVGSQNIVGFWLDANAVRLGALYSSNFLVSFVTEMTAEQRNTLPDLSKPGYKEGVRFLNKMYHEGLINQDFALATTTDPYRQALANGYIASVSDTYWQLFGGDAIKALVDKTPNAFYEAGPIFQNYAGEYRRELYLPIDMILMVPSFSRNADAAVKYLDWLSTPDVNEFLWWGNEGEHHTVQDGLEVLLPVEQRRDSADMPFLNNWDMSLVRRNAFYDWSTPEGMERGLEAAVLGLRNQGRDAEADMRVAGQRVSLVDGFTPPFFGRPIVAEGRYGSVLADKHVETIIRSIMAEPGRFDAVFDGLLAEYMNAGGRQVIEERQRAYRESIAN